MRILLTIFLVLLPLLAHGKPVINTAPTWNPTMTISGSNFGAKETDAPLRYDDFNRGVDGEAIPSSADTWHFNTGAVYFDDDNVRIPGQMSAYQNYTNTYSRYIKLSNKSWSGMIPPTDEMYFSGWFKYKDYVRPSRNAKVINFGTGEGWQSRLDVYPATKNGHLYAHSTDDCEASGNIADWGTKPTNSLRPDGEWHRYETYIKLGPNGYRDFHVDGEMIGEISGEFSGSSCTIGYILIGHYFGQDYIETGADRGDDVSCASYATDAVTRSKDDGKYYTCEADGTWNSGSSTKPAVPQAERWWDEMYVDITRARVEIGDSSTFEDCNHREVQIPTNWSSNSITVTTNQGTFNEGDSVYLFVVDEDGVASDGKLMSIGEAAPDTDPPFIAFSTPADGQTSVELNVTNSIAFDGPINESTLNVSIDCGSKGTTSYTGSTATFTTSGQSNSETCIVTVAGGLEDTSGNAEPSPMTYSFTTQAPAATCSNDPVLCSDSDSCLASWPTYNWCPDEATACKDGACDNSCSAENWYLCTDQAEALANGLYFRDGAARTKPQFVVTSGPNLINNPHLTSWTGGVPDGWAYYVEDNIEQNSLGARIFDGASIVQQDDGDPNLLIEGQEYYYEYNVISASGQTEFYYSPVFTLTSGTGTISGTFTAPYDSPDHRVFFKSPDGTTAVMRDFVLKEISANTPIFTRPEGTPINTTAGGTTWDTQ